MRFASKKITVPLMFAPGKAIHMRGEFKASWSKMHWVLRPDYFGLEAEDRAHSANAVNDLTDRATKTASGRVVAPTVDSLVFDAISCFTRID